MTFDPDKLPAPTTDWALFLDVDGTLVDIAPSPYLVTVPPELPGLLARLTVQLDGALALVTGRSLSDLDRLLGFPAATAAGQHGAEIRRRGRVVETADGVGHNPAVLLPALEAFAAERPGLLIEYKGSTIAAHYRLAPRFADELHRFLLEITVPYRSWLGILAGHSVFELKPLGVSKGRVVECLMRGPPFAGRTPVFIGDDETDEDGFAAVNAAGGYAIRVGDCEETLAPWRLPDPASVRGFLTRATGMQARANSDTADADA